MKLLNGIVDDITPKGDFLCNCDPHDIPRLNIQLKEYETIIQELDNAINILKDKNEKV